MENTINALIVPKKDNLYVVADGVIGQKIVFVNLYYITGSDGPGGNWVLVDAGVYGSAARIKKTAEDRFGKGARPSAIILTHGHFDHVGALKELATEWNVPVYAHHLEIPYLTGLSGYPPPDPMVGGGGIAYMSFLYPKKPIEMGGMVQPLPEDGTVPGLPEWRWFHTPGHSPGHVSFFRERDRILIAGDAITTRDPESMLAVMTDEPEVCGPPAYYTPDWQAAKASVSVIAALKPNVIAAGHGIPMRGERMLDELNELDQYFDQMAKPTHGRYVNQPAIMDEQGVVSVPESVSTPTSKAFITAGLVTVAGLAVYAITRKRRSNGQHVESPLDTHLYTGEEMNLSVYGEIPDPREDHNYHQDNAPLPNRDNAPLPNREDIPPTNYYP